MTYYDLLKSYIRYKINERERERGEEEIKVYVTIVVNKNNPMRRQQCFYIKKKKFLINYV